LVLFSTRLFFLSFFHRSPSPYIYTLSLHDALPISFDHSFLSAWPAGGELGLTRFFPRHQSPIVGAMNHDNDRLREPTIFSAVLRSEEHTSELPVTWPSRMPSSA